MQAPDATARPIDALTSCGAPDAPALVDRNGVLSFAELEVGVGALAAKLLAGGCKAGDRVASWLNKTRVACLMPLAAARAGLIHVPINPLLKHAQVAHILQDSGARLLITGEQRRATLMVSDVPSDCMIVDETALTFVGDVMTS